MFLSADRKTYDFKKLKDITKVVAKNLNKIIDINYYPLPEVSFIITSVLHTERYGLHHFYL